MSIASKIIGVAKAVFGMSPLPGGGVVIRLASDGVALLVEQANGTDVFTVDAQDGVVNCFNLTSQSNITIGQGYDLRANSFARFTVTNPTLFFFGNTPAQITGDVNDYAPGAGVQQRWSADAARNVTGMAAGSADGETRYIWNVGAQTITLKDESTSTASSAANRFLTATGADLALAAKKCAVAMYDATAARWRVSLLP